MTKSMTVLLGLILAAAALGAQEEAAGPRTIAVSEISAGMTGYGLTVVKGREPRRFEVEVLGVLRNIMPQRDAILIRAEGLELEKSGIFGGMSGSPVYIDGRLAGAVAFGWGWPKEPIAGVTPIGEMEAAFNSSAGTVGHEASWKEFDLAAYLEGRGLELLGRMGAGPTEVSQGGLTALQVPLVMPVLGAQAREIVQGLFGGGRFFLAEGAAGAVEAKRDGGGMGELSAGSNVVAALVTGDIFMGAVGTVTDVRGEDIYCFGHPFMNIDDMRIPMYTGEAHVVFSSSMRSFKIASPVGEVGAFVRDRATGILGRLGEKGDTFAMTVRVLRGGEEQTYRYEVLRHWALGGQLAVTAAASSLTTLGDLPAEATLSYDFRVAYDGGRRLEIRRRVSGAGALSELAGDVGGALSITMFNPLENLEPEKVELEVSVLDGDKSAEIVSVSAAEGEVEPGGTVRIEAVVRPVHGGEVRISVEVKVPQGAQAGRKAIVVCDGRTSDLLDVREAANRLEPKSVDELLDVLEPKRGADMLVARLAAAGHGVARSGVEFPNLPSSTLAVLASPRDTGVTPVYSSVVAEVRTDYILSGKKVLGIYIKGGTEKK